MAKRPEHIEEARNIGEDSWHLLNFIDLPKRAGKQRQIEALRLDQKWLRNHIGEVCDRIDRLIRDIEEGRA